MNILLLLFCVFAVPFRPEFKKKDVPQDSEEENDEDDNENNKQTDSSDDSSSGSALEDNLSTIRQPRMLIFGKNGMVVYDGTLKKRCNRKTYLKTKSAKSVRKEVGWQHESTEVQTNESLRQIQGSIPSEENTQEITDSRLQPNSSELLKPKITTSKACSYHSKPSLRCYPQDSQLGAIRHIAVFPFQVGSLVRAFHPQLQRILIGTVRFFVYIAMYYLCR